jgi:uncharacterized membrane protein (DUF485 family)
MRDFDPLQYFSWWVFVAAGFFYTVMAFSPVLHKESGLVFTKRNAKPLSAILTVHLEFLMILFGLMWIAPFLYPRLPGWLIDTVIVRGATHSIADIFFVFVMAIMYLVERRYIYVEADTQLSKAEQ